MEGEVNKVAQFPRHNPYKGIIDGLAAAIKTAERDVHYNLWQRFKWTREFTRTTTEAIRSLDNRGKTDSPTGRFLWGMVWNASRALTTRCLITKAFALSYAQICERNGVSILH